MTIKRYARATTAQELQRPAQYRRTLVDPYRDHLRRRLAEDPDVAVTRLLAEIRDLGYPGSANLLVRYLNQGRAAADRTPPSPRPAPAPAATGCRSSTLTDHPRWIRAPRYSGRRPRPDHDRTRPMHGPPSIP